MTTEPLANAVTLFVDADKTGHVGSYKESSKAKTTYQSHYPTKSVQRAEPKAVQMFWLCKCFPNPAIYSLTAATWLELFQPCHALTYSQMMGNCSTYSLVFSKYYGPEELLFLYPIYGLILICLVPSLKATTLLTPLLTLI